MATVVEKEVTYKDGDTECVGFLAYDDAAIQGGRKVPGVLIVHQWMGLTDYEKRRARMLAELGYVALAADIYGKGVRPTDSKGAGEQAGKFRSDNALFRSRLNAGLGALKAQPGVDAARLGAIGYCFGGGGVLELARSGANVKGVVSFHGGLGTPHPEDAKNIKGKILVCHGAIDRMETPESIAAFQKSMEDAKVDYVFMAFAGAKHAFTQPEAGNNPDSPVAYNKAADERSWIAMKNFFTEIFSK